MRTFIGIVLLLVAFGAAWTGDKELPAYRANKEQTARDRDAEELGKLALTMPILTAADFGLKHPDAVFQCEERGLSNIRKMQEGDQTLIKVMVRNDETATQAVRAIIGLAGVLFLASLIGAAAILFPLKRVRARSAGASA
jgi:hypothetical protein